MIGFAMAVALFALRDCAAMPQNSASPQKPVSAGTSAVVDINRASVEDFARLPGVGSKLAQQIVAYRAKQGPFRRVEDLMIIKGIGDKKYKALRPFVCVGCGTRTR